MLKDLLKIEWSNQPVLTTEGLAKKFGCSSKNLRDNFANNRDRFIEGKHYFKLEGEQLNILRTDNIGIQISDKVRVLYLWTKRGVARHAKILSTDAAWEVYEVLEDTYFNKQVPTVLTSDYLFYVAEQMRIKEQELKDAERRAKENLDAKLLQDHATSIGKKYKHKLGRASKCLNVKGLGRNTLFSFLRDNNILFYDDDGYNEVYQRYINEEKFFQKLDDTYEYPVIYITPKGMRYVLQMLVNEGYEPRMSAEEWDMLCRQLPEDED